ncbi:MAG: hypothetical protein HN833_03485 [Elusimicrobiaceae bacterium]|jgi:phosphatidylserine/phosphatidylglycerophosphate/cardiolipin synthase-like enzyme|nr:hypothetical protein [Elusimicrobiaceae bacterium]MBT3954995.1 hypothetical protein [Elusimicrobiaceae bacterium]MBT4008113.1 hypothetical protein [Elusimicrobiaceae bacterium]MBT4402691.1 hypothetical protein [Elusimicrobiaceae bacterium]MBT4440025.1 hypothetical protein [Elusimicrobiaceae bacterium]
MKQKIIILLAVIMAILFMLFPAKKGDEIIIVQSIAKNTVPAHPETTTTLDAWLTMIKGAKKEILIQMPYMISKDGNKMKWLVKALKDSAESGVKVKILLDEMFTRKITATISTLRKYKNIEYKIVDISTVPNCIQHAKIIITDSQNVFLGSQNFDYRALDEISEIGLIVKNKSLAESFKDVFNFIWHQSANQTTHGYSFENIVSNQNPISAKFKGEDIQIYPSFSPVDMFSQIHNTLISEIIKIINSSDDTLYLSVMTFNPTRNWTEISDALIKAEKRGVKINLMFADWTLKKSASKIKKLQRQMPSATIKIATIPQPKEFIPYARVVHTKFIVADGNKLLLTTANFEKDYFYKNIDAGLTIKSKNIAKIFEDIFKDMFNSKFASQI